MATISGIGLGGGNPAVTSADIADDSIVNADIKTTAAIAYAKLAALTSANLLIGSAANVATVTAVTGDVTISNAGVTAIGLIKVTNAMLADDAVGLDEMAAGTDGNLITYDASGNPAAVATGDAGQVLTSNGVGAAPTFQAAVGGSGAVTKLAAGVLTVQAATAAYDTDYVDVDVAVGGNASDLIEIHLFGFAAGNQNLHCNIDLEDTTANPTGSLFALSLSASDGSALINVMQHGATSDILQYRGRYSWTGDGTFYRTEAQLDSNDANIMTTAFKIRLNFKHNAASSAASTVRYMVRRTSGA